jgi:hypothetical protein
MSHFIANVPGDEMMSSSLASAPGSPAEIWSNAAERLAASSRPAGVKVRLCRGPVRGLTWPRWGLSFVAHEDASSLRYLARSFATGQALSPCAMRSSVTARLLGQRGMPRLPLRRRDVAEAQGPGQRGKHAASRHELFASFLSTAHLSTALAQIGRSKLRS